MLPLLQTLSILSCAWFAGAAVYINLVEHPARMSCDTETAATVWVPSYERATMMQASLAIASLLAGLGAWLLGGGTGWLVGAVLIGLVVPFTLLAVQPLNRRLMTAGRDLASEETRALLDRWAQLHAVRSGLAVIASVVFVTSLTGGAGGG